MRQNEKYYTKENNWDSNGNKRDDLKEEDTREEHTS